MAETLAEAIRLEEVNKFSHPDAWCVFCQNEHHPTPECQARRQAKDQAEYDQSRVPGMLTQARQLDEAGKPEAAILIRYQAEQIFRSSHFGVDDPPELHHTSETMKAMLRQGRSASFAKCTLYALKEGYVVHSGQMFSERPETAKEAATSVAFHTTPGVTTRGINQLAKLIEAWDVPKMQDLVRKWPSKYGFNGQYGD